MASLNKCMFIGRLGKDPEVRMAGETKVANFSIAISEKFKDKDGNPKEKTEWINLVYWGRQAEICEQFLRKGALVYVEGKFETRNWDDKTTGNKVYRTEVRGYVLQMLGGKGDQSNSAPQQPQDGDFSAPPAPEDDLPF